MAVVRRSYGGPWQEFRALVATGLLNLALLAHFRATMDLAADLDRLRRLSER